MTNQPIALYTCAAHPRLPPDDQVLLPALARVGLTAIAQRWDEPLPAGISLPAALFRSTWDYYLRLPEFLAFLATLTGPLPVFNAPALLRWNLDKRYLLELAQLGVPIVPTRFLPTLDADALPALWEELGELVVKPAVSAGGWRTLRLKKGAALPTGSVGRGQGSIAGGPDPEPDGYLVQPLIPQIIQGEWSLVFFDGEFSHAVRKYPAAGDFRIQEQYGGTTEPVVPPAPLLAQAQDVMAALLRVPAAAGAVPLYARVDAVLVDGRLLLMELELIEPALYFKHAPAAADRLAQALRRRLG